MLDFMILALPRSATTWAANWLSGEHSYCAHDPLWTSHYRDLDRVVGDQAGARIGGIACTGLWRWAEWVNAHPAPKLVLHRDRAEIDRSLAAIGYPPLPRAAPALLRAVRGTHLDYRELFDPVRAREIWATLTRGAPFDGARHAQLTEMRIEPKFDGLRIDPGVTRRLLREVGALAAQ